MKKFFVLNLLVFCSIFLTAISTAQPLIGNYTINATQPANSTNFQSFTAFATAVNQNGISGNVMATVVQGSGPYLEQVTFAGVSGTGPSATITIDGNGEILRSITNTNLRHALRLTNCQYFNIFNLEIERDTNSTSGFYGIHIFGTGNHITIDSCEVRMPGTTSTLTGAYIASGSETSILETGDFHNISITNNRSSGGGYGASVFGLVSNLASGIVISGNQFNDFHSNGVYLRETNGAIVNGNIFDKSSPNITTVNAIQLAQAANINGRIYDNRIIAGQTSNGSMTFRGIYLFNGTGHRVYNNVITEINLTSGNVTGIEVRTGSTAPEIFFNTIAFDNGSPTTGNLTGIKEELSNTNSVLRNNMISITQPTSGNKAALVLGANSTPSSALTSNHNNYWVPGGHTAIRGSLTPVFYTTLAAWQAISSQDAASISVDPLFTSSALPQPTNSLMDNAGSTIPGIITDYLGNVRGVVPDIGAFEFNNVGLTDAGVTNVRIWPNPFLHEVYIDIPAHSDAAGEILIFDSLGRLIVKKVNGGWPMKVDMSRLASGFYYIIIHTAGFSFSHKLVKF